MNAEQLLDLLQRVQAGSLPVEQAVAQLSHLPFADLGFARVDHHRALRQGIAEVVFAPGKSNEQLIAISRELAARDQTVLLTRLNAEQAAALKAAFPTLDHNPVARTAVLVGPATKPRPGDVLIVTAGTSDLPVAEEARVTLAAAGVAPRLLSDVGVAGLHRLLAVLSDVRRANVVIVVAGMDAALASVVGGLVSAPVIAVPTSVGYGASFHGLAALLSMLSSCAAGISCVNIDNGFGAAMAALRFLNESSRVATSAAATSEPERT
jgi:pyridinium-3,5-biscarboxylic acid mononucleotide synthase